MNNSDDIKLLLKYFPELSVYQQSQFASLKKIITGWNTRINIISRSDVSFLFERHVLHSLSIAKFIQFNKGSKILDVGTGGGFPGIPLSILFPDSEFHLTDSIGKKIIVVEDIINELSLKNTSAQKIRAENVQHRFDFVVTRAVADFSTIYNWVKEKFIKENNHGLANGIIALKGGELGEELKNFSQELKVIPVNTWFSENFFNTKKIVYLPCNKH